MHTTIEKPTWKCIQTHYVDKDAEVTFYVVVQIAYDYLDYNNTKWKKGSNHFLNSFPHPDNSKILYRVEELPHNVAPKMQNVRLKNIFQSRCSLRETTVVSGHELWNAEIMMYDQHGSVALLKYCLFQNNFRMFILSYKKKKLFA